MSLTLEFSGPVWYWKGPAPHHFVTVPAEQAQDIRAAARFVTYGWGMIPVTVRVGETVWKTSLFPKDGLYLLPVKLAVRTAEQIEEGDEVTVQLEVG
ncbi:DUF1905 domain-containing protein [Deinococcus radiopugnans]|uniref:DUF1905 domain-containing protein n=1 Tax=Deinococcus radiopugnans ATCC 19172 TaxID=585398 RepID=A0A5C4Y663_9DEIO|nr:DUF1905 domain-containing protein [Deinococcus radiopugnans]MBB6017196.1 hypothetical protein [Deinococcus radiopugnans ATCC 19172]TNM70515.1 DUF1905 domain-containing protein [Deinococcus radiopugnans ATCC 19172]